jgi:hypothetical protein
MSPQGSVVPTPTPPDVRDQMASAPPEQMGADKAGQMGAMAPKRDPKQLMQAYMQKVQDLEKWASDFSTIASLVDPEVSQALLVQLAQVGKALKGRAMQIMQGAQAPPGGQPSAPPPAPNPAEGPTPSPEATSGLAA